MEKSDRNAILAIGATVIVAAGVALAGSQGGATVAGLPVFALCVALAFVIQWVVFIPAWALKSEHFYDLTGTATYVTVTSVAVLLATEVDARSVLLLALVVVWTVRLGSYLFRRVLKAGKDDRFDTLKTSFWRFLNTWTLQGLWVSLTLGATLAAITTTSQKDLDVFAVIGALIWVAGFAVEAVADAQKSRFRADPANKGRFIHTGLWAWSRHPNYFGEIVLWIGIAVIAIPVLQGWQWVTLISPVFVFLLITRVSGVPMLEKKADKKWGGQDDYEAYKAGTPVLVPLPPGSKRGAGR